MTWPHRLAVAAREGRLDAGRWGDARLKRRLLSLWVYRLQAVGEGMSGKEGWVLRAYVRARRRRPENERSRRIFLTATSDVGASASHFGYADFSENKLTSPATHNEHCYGSTNTQDSHYLGLMSIIIYSKSCTHAVFTSSHTSSKPLLI